VAASQVGRMSSFESSGCGVSVGAVLGAVDLKYQLCSTPIQLGPLPTFTYCRTDHHCRSNGHIPLQWPADGAQ